MARGDHIFVHCTGFSHHGIDCGDGRVIHFDFTPKRKFWSCLGGDSSSIRETTLEQFCGGRQIHVREYSDGFSAEKVVARAESRLGESGYHLFGKNCEHFAQWCKVGISQSSQVDAARTAATPLRHGAMAAAAFRVMPLVPLPVRLAASGVTLAASLGRAAGTYFRERNSDIQNQRS